ncbi:hypothetical protein AAG906_028418 [Vitis piasezkii]
MRGCCTLTTVSYSCTGTDLDDKNASPEVALEFLNVPFFFQMVRVPAIGKAKATDATGAGDLFAGGFLYGGCVCYLGCVCCHRKTDS